MEALTEYCPDKVNHLLKTTAYFISGIVCILFVYYGVVHISKLQLFGAKSPAMQLRILFHSLYPYPSLFHYYGIQVFCTFL